MKDVANHYQAEQYIKYRHSVEGAFWNEARGKWELTIQTSEGASFVDECDVFVNAGGVLK
jgi:cation diffusion facilitator CzcD-associated flavoprotein CzcO